MSTYLNFSLQSRQDIKDWIMRQFGYPLVTVEITEDQLDDCVNDALELFTEYVIQDEMFYGIDLEQYDSSGYTMPDNVTSVFALEDSHINDGVFGGVNRLFSIPNQMWNAGAFPSFATGAGGAWLSYEISMQYLDLTKRMLAGGFDFVYNERQQLLTLYPDPNLRNMKGYVCVGCNVIRDEEYQYGENWVKKFSMARAKQIIGNIRSKYRDIRLPGGGMVDLTIKNEGLKEEEKLKDELRKKYVSGRFFIG